MALIGIAFTVLTFTAFLQGIVCTDSPTAENSIRQCFKDHNSDLDGAVDKARKCADNLTNDENWETSLCQNLKNDKIPCFDDIFKDDLQHCLQETEFQILKSLVSSILKFACQYEEHQSTTTTQ